MEVPEWRIVSEELWEAAHARMAAKSRKFSAACLGGLNWTERSRSYLFSGLLICGKFGARLVRTSGSGKRASVRYGCPSHRYRGVCSNSECALQWRPSTVLRGDPGGSLSRFHILEVANCAAPGPDQVKSSAGATHSTAEAHAEADREWPGLRGDGALDLLNENDVMPVVARDGIEPPTPAFSGLRSTN